MLPVLVFDGGLLELELFGELGLKPLGAPRD
jgi:hypothetical protein